MAEESVSLDAAPASRSLLDIFKKFSSFINGVKNLKRIHAAFKPVLETGIATRVDFQLKKEIPDGVSVWCPWALAAYAGSDDEIQKQLKDHGFDEFIPKFGPKIFEKRTYFVARKGDYIVVSIRGTQGLYDTIADIIAIPSSVELDGVKGKAHMEFSKSAKYVFDATKDNILYHLKDETSYRLVVTGHSLGGATALLLSFLFKDELKKQGLDNSRVECWTYGCPPCISEEFVPKANFIHNTVYNDDIVSRASYKNLNIALSEDSDNAYLEELNGYNQDVRGNAEAIKRAIEGKRKTFDTPNALVCPGILYHLLSSQEHPEVDSTNKPYIAYVSEGPTSGLNIVVASDTMISDHSQYMEVLWPQSPLTPSISAELQKLMN